jgi:hypothetical protein
MTIDQSAELATMADIARIAAARGLALPLAELVIGPNAIAELPRVAANLTTAPVADIAVLVDAVSRQTSRDGDSVERGTPMSAGGRRRAR